MATQLISGVQYSGIWNLSSQANALAAGTWPAPGGGRLYAWGRNDYGQLGLNNTTDTSSPNQVGTDYWLSVPTSFFYSLASIKPNGTLWMCGRNNNGQLGLGNTTYYSSPKQVGALSNWLQVAAGYAATLAVKKDGTLWSWGYGGVGTLGLGNTTSYSSPKQIGALTTWKYVVTGVFASAAIKTDGTLWTWGNDQLSGILGLGNTTTYSSPKQVGALTNWLSIYFGQYTAAAVKTDGTLWMWGRGTNGALGLGNTTNYSSPKQVGALTSWLKTATNYAGTSGAVKTDGTLWMWGRNNVGQLGLGNITNYSSPKQVGSLTNWSQITIGYTGGVVTLKTDGTLWAWGANNRGQLGLGDTTSRSSPVQVGTATTWLQIAGGAYSVLALG